MTDAWDASTHEPEQCGGRCETHCSVHMHERDERTGRTNEQPPASTSEEIVPVSLKGLAGTRTPDFSTLPKAEAMALARANLNAAAPVCRCCGTKRTQR